MAETIWTGATDGDWDDNSNWSGNKPDGSGGSHDPVTFPASSSQAVTTGHTNENAVDCSTILIQPGFDASIGSAGNELYISTGNLYHYGGGELHLKAGDNRVNDVYIDANPASSTTLSASLVGTGTTDFENINLVRGVVTIGSATTDIARLSVGRRTGASDVSLTNSGTMTITSMDMWSGTAVNNGAVTTLLMSGGTLTHLTSAVTTVKQFGGRINWGSTSNVTTLYLYGGTFDARYNNAEFTISTLYMWPGATFIEGPRTTVTTRIVAAS